MFLTIFRIEIDELRKNNLVTEKRTLEITLNNIQFENKNTVKREQFSNLSSECDTITVVIKTNLNSISQKLNECLNDLEIINVQATTTNQG